MNQLIKKPSAWIPVVLSCIMLAILLWFLGTKGVVHEEDEGVGAHLFQIWLVLEVVLVPIFALKWLPQAPRAALEIIALQIIIALAVIAPVFFFQL